MVTGVANALPRPHSHSAESAGNVSLAVSLSKRHTLIQFGQRQLDADLRHGEHHIAGHHMPDPIVAGAGKYGGRLASPAPASRSAGWTVCRDTPGS